MKRRLFAAFLSLCLTLTLVPATAWAAEPDDTTDPPGTSTPAPAEATESVPEPTPAPEPDRTSEPEPEATLAALEADISGVVLDAVTKEPVAATINLYAQDGKDVLATTETDPKTGSYSIQTPGGLPVGRYTLSVLASLSIYVVPYQDDVEITTEGVSVLNDEILLPYMGSCSGTVTDKDTGAALENVQVEARRDGQTVASTTTDSSGTYSLVGERGNCQITFSKDGYKSQTISSSMNGPLSETELDVQLTAGTSDEPAPTIVASGECGDNLSWTLDDKGTLTISGTGTMWNYGRYDYSYFPLSQRETIQAVQIAEGVTSIGDCAFYYCSNLKKVRIPESITSIGEDAFSGCSSLKEVFIPEGVTSIGEDAFSGCSSLKEVFIPKSATFIGKYVFDGCRSLPSARIPDGVTSIGDSVFSGCSSLKEVYIPDDVTSIGGNAFSGCRSLPSVRIPESVTSIGGSVFSGCSSLKEVRIPGGVTSIGDGVFTYCSSLTSISVDASNTAFSSNEQGLLLNKGRTVLLCCPAGKTTVTIPDGVTSIGEDAFCGCRNLKEVRIPGGVTFIGEWAFSDCSSLKDVYYAGSEEQWKKIDGYYRLPSSATIHYNSAGPVTPEQPKVEHYGSEDKVSNSKELLQSYVDNWNTAYTNYTNAVGGAIKSEAAVAKPSREETIEKRKMAMMQADDANKDPFATRYIYAPEGFPSKTMKNAAYRGLSEFLYDHIFSSPDYSSLTLDDIKNPSQKLIKKLFGNFRDDSATYPIGYITVSICSVSNGVGFGNLTCRDNSPSAGAFQGWPYEYALCSNQQKCYEAIREYLTSLEKLEDAAIDGVYDALWKDVLGQSISSLTQARLAKCIEKYAKRLPPQAVHLLDNLNTCCNYYQYIKQLMALTDVSNAPESLLSSMEAIKFDDSTITDKAAKKAWDALKKASDLLTDAYKNAVRGTLDESKLVTYWNNTMYWMKDGFAKFKATFTCPVDVQIYDSNGTLVGSITEEDTQVYNEDAIYIEESGGAKIVYSFLDEPLSFDLTATDYGTLGCSFEHYDSEGQPTGRANFYDIAIAPNQELSARSTQNTIEETPSYQITSAGQEIAVNEVLPATDQTASVAIQCSVESEGEVSGAGKYVRGDAVVLVAAPDEDHRFIGWYDGEHLLETSRIYEFTATKDLNLKAVFVNPAASASVMLDDTGKVVTVSLPTESIIQNVFCTFEDANGRFLECQTRAVSEISEEDPTFTFTPKDQSATKGKVFLLDNQWRPVSKAHNISLAS